MVFRLISCINESVVKLYSNKGGLTMNMALTMNTICIYKLAILFLFYTAKKVDKLSYFNCFNAVNGKHVMNNFWYSVFLTETKLSILTVIFSTFEVFNYALLYHSHFVFAIAQFIRQRLGEFLSVKNSVSMQNMQ